jgi:N4-gp56 family major capsid protein
MATTAYGVNHPLAVKLWAKKLYREALKECFVGKFIGSTQDSLIYEKDETSKSAGDRITVGLRMQLTGAGVAGDGTLEGQEESLTTYDDSILIDQLRHAVRSDGKMSEQRVPFSVRDEAMNGLRDWWADRIDTAFFNHIGGNTGQADLRYTGSNATVAPSTTTGNARIVYGPDDETTENSLSSASASNNFQLTIIDKAVTLAKTANPLIRPVKTSRGPKYVAFLHPYQVYSLKTDATAARVTWYDAQKALVTGGDKENGIFSGALGEYNGVILHESTRVPLSAASGVTTVRRAVLCGAQAATIAFGRETPSDSEAKWVEELFDYGNQLGVSAGMIWGLKKSRFNSIDFGTIVMATHAEAPA